MSRSSDAAQASARRRGTSRRTSRDRNLRQLAWAGFGIVSILFAVGLWVSFRDRIGGPQTTSWGTSDFFGQELFGLSTFAFPVVGILILSRQVRNPVGWICLAVGLAWGIDGILSNVAGHAFPADPSTAALADVLDSWLWIPAIGLMGTFLLLLFPNGHLPSPRWRGVAWLSAISMVVSSLAIVLSPGSLADDGYPTLTNPLGLRSLEWLIGPLQFVLILVPVCIVACVVSLVLRYRRARGRDRLQLKWLTGGAAVVGIIFVLAMVASFGFGNGRGSEPTWVRLVEDASLFSFALVPSAIGIAILKHRLYNIDVVINKTLVFGALAAFITAVYVAVVVGIGSAIGHGREPNLALSIAATAIVAVAFQPVRERVQHFANRLVYGKRATPYEVLSRFAQTIASSYGAEELLPRTADTLREATGAAASSVWLVVGDRLVPAAESPSGGEEPLVDREVRPDGFPEVAGERSAPIIDGGELVGALTITKAEDTIVPADQELLDNLASQAGQIVRNARLTADLQTRLEQLAIQSRELRRSRQRIVAAQDDERRALERNIHDGAQQYLVALAVKLKLTKTLVTRAPDRATTMLKQLRGEVGDTLAALRELASGIYPADLEEGGVAQALKAATRDFPVPTVIDSPGLRRYPIDSEATVYFCCLEGLQNVAKYAAASRATVSLRDEDGTIAFSVQDDGVGFDPGSTVWGSGLRNISDRVAASRGSVEISSAPGAGTTISGRIPVKELEAVR